MGTCTRTSRQAVQRGLFWSLSLPCSPIEWDGEEWDCSVHCDWLQWPIQDWTQLDNAMLFTCVHPATVECSLYIDSHHPVRLESLALKRVSHLARFEVELTGSFDLKGYNELDADDIPLALHGVLDFEGVVVVPNNLWPKPTDPDQAVRALAPFLNQSNVSAPEWDRFRYVFKGLA